MSTASFVKGTTIEIDGCEYTLIRLIEPGEWQLEGTEKGDLRRMTQVAMLDGFVAGTMAFVVKSDIRPGTAAAFRKENSIKQFETLPEGLRKLAKLRRAIVTGVIAEYGPSWQVKQATDKISQLWLKNNQPTPAPHPISVWRWSKRYLASGKDIRSLVNLHHRCGNYNSRFHEKVEQIVRDAVVKIYLTEERQTYQDTLDHAVTEVTRENRLRLECDQLHMPSINLVRRIANEVPAFDRYAARYGRQAAERRFRAVLGQNIVNKPLKRVEIDHTRIDLFVVDDETYLPLGRPWLTICIDVGTRVILGFDLSFDPPSHTTVARALKHAMLPKGPLSKKYPTVKNSWDAYGVMDAIVMDNGPEFHSESLEAACYSLGIDMQYCPRKQPWFKGVVERVQGSLNRGVAHGVPGTTFSNIVDKDDYNAAKKAIITLRVLWEIIHIWIVDYYHQRPHKGLGDLPAHAWKVETAGMDIRLPANPKDLDAVLGKIASRKLSNRGIEINNLFYNTREAADLLRLLGHETEVSVRYSEDNLGHIYILAPNTNEYMLVKAVDFEYADGLTLWQHKVCKRFAARELGGRTDTVALAEAKRRIRELVETEFFRKRHKTRTSSHRFLNGGKGIQSSDAGATEQATQQFQCAPSSAPQVVSAPISQKALPTAVPPQTPVAPPSFAPIQVRRLPAAGNQPSQEI